LAMDTIGYLILAYMGVGILLGFGSFYLDGRLKRYVDRQYPEEGTVIRSYEWQWYPWSVGRKVLRKLIKKQSDNDPELAQHAKRAKRSTIYFFVWFSIGLILFFIRVLLFLAK